MIFAPGALEDSESIFRGRGGDPFIWQSQLPGISVSNNAWSDPALANEISSGAASWNVAKTPSGKLIATPAQQFIGQLGIYSVVGGLRNAVGQISVTVGYLQRSMTIIDGFYADPLQSVAMSLNVVSDILNSDAFNAAINSIGWIPIVGWIIKILVEVAKIVVSIVDMVAGKNREEAIKELNARTTIPKAEFSVDADTNLGKLLQIQAGSYNLQWMLMPRYPAEAASDFIGRRVDANNDAFADAWVLYTQEGDPDDQGSSRGLGFVPGTRNIHGSMELSTRGGGNLSDLGNFYPITQALAANLWEQMLKGHPMSMTVDTDLAEEAWASYIYSALDLAYPGSLGGSDIMPRGWSLSPVAEFAASTHRCVEGMTGMMGCSSGDVKFARTIDIPGHGHTYAYTEYLKVLFDYKRKNSGGDWSLGNIDPYDSRPVRNLKSLREQQESLLKSMDCMYFTNSQMQNGAPQFGAIGTASNKGPLYNLWRNNVQAYFDSGDWRFIDWRDVPPHMQGGTPNQIRSDIEHLCQQNYDMSADEFFGSKHGWFIDAPKNVFPKDPVPPPAPEDPVFVETAAFIDAAGVGGGGTKTSAAGLALAAGAALLLLRGRK